MKIKLIGIYNYRILKDLVFDLENELTLIIGKNNCGKTSVLSILNKFIGDKSSTNNFSYEDFNLNFKNFLFQSVEKNGQDWDTLARKGIELYLYIDYDDKDNIANIKPLMLDLEPENNHIIIKFEYILTNEKMISLIDSFDLYYNRFSSKTDKRIKKVVLFDNFMKAKHKQFFAIKKKAILYDIKTQLPLETEYRLIDSNSVDIKKIISFKYIDARRDTVNSDGDSTLTSLSVKYYEKTKTDDNNPIIQKFEDELIDTDTSLTGIYEGLFDGVIQKVKKFGGIRENETVVKIISTLSQQNLLKGNTTVVYEACNHQLPESYNGLGYLNLINIIFEIETILSEFRYDKDDTITPSDINLFFIEEPEAHTHPQMQYVFIKNIKKLLHEGSSGELEKKKINLQTIISTHSSHIVSECDFDDIKYFRKMSQTNVLSKNLKDLEIAYKDEKESKNNHFKFLKQYLTLNYSEVFFADKVIFFEGDTERILLHAMMKKIDQEEENPNCIPLLSQNISLIEAGAYSQIFDKFLVFLGIKTLIITDIDAGIEKKRKKPNSDETEATDIVASPVESGTHTTNGALKHYYSESLRGAKGSQLGFFTEMKKDMKILANNNGSWLVDPNGSLMVIYQTLESTNKNYYPRSFEDAFIHVNRKFIIDYIDNFVSLKNSSYFSMKKEDGLEYTYDSFYLANNCIKSKASFAMDILLNSKHKNKTDLSIWQIPSYIKEGLLWLRQDS